MNKIITSSEARAAGLKRYFTGEPCNRGHIAEKYVDAGCVVCCAIGRKAWRAANMDKCRASSSKWRKNNPEKSQAAIDAWSAKHPEKVQAYQARYHAANVAKRREKTRKWTAANPEKARVMWRARRARKKAAVGSHTADDVAAIAEAQMHRCAYCRIKVRKANRHVDHIVALSRGGANDRRNLQITCEPCNLRKRAKDPIDFAREIGRLC